MQKWFFLEDPNNEALRKGHGDAEVSVTPSVVSQFLPKSWLFRVYVKNVKQNEVVCVSGNIPELGSWDPNKTIKLEQDLDDKTLWSTIIEIPDRVKVYYRYCISIIVEENVHHIIRTWETNIIPRIIDGDISSPTITDEPQRYGANYSSCSEIDHGWLNKETAIQLKLLNNPITIWNPTFANRSIYVKLTPVNLLQHITKFPQNIAEALEESLNTDTLDMIEIPKHVITEVASLQNDDSIFQEQPKFGVQYHDNEMLVFQCTVLSPKTTVYLLDFFIYGTRVGDGEPPYHAGFSYVLSSALQGSEGSIVVPITSTKHRPLGELTVDYLVIRPLPNFRCDLSLSYTRHWKHTRAGLDVGHRGAGSSFKDNMKNCAEVRENTVASFRTAIDHGADFVEFDVQLSKDLIPIIYHDFHAAIAMKRKKELSEMDMLEIPIKDLTLEQLKLLKVYHLSEGKAKIPKFFDEDLEDHQPFPTLEHLFGVLNIDVGFNIEIKWTMQRLDKSYELYHPTDLNLYIDTILEVVLQHAGDRRIIFSCFNPDVCAMIRMKQNKYPVMFLTQGETSKWPKYIDPRCWDIQSAARYAKMIEILGINVHTEDILREPSSVKLATEAHLIIFCWGDDNADPATIQYLKELGMHGVIYDKIDQNSRKEVKESIFLVEARESQKDLLRHTAEIAQSPSSPSPAEQVKEPLLDVDRALACIDNISTATSLQSLETTISDYQKKTDNNKNK